MTDAIGVIAGLFISGFLLGAAVGIARRHLSPPRGD